MTDKQINHEQSSVIIDGVDVSGCPFYFKGDYFSCAGTKSTCFGHSKCPYKQLKNAEKTVEECHKYQAKLEDELEAKEQECERLKAEIKLAKEMLIQNTSETNKYTIPQIIEQFISDNYIDQQNDDGYTIPVFIQIENILDIKETLEQQLDQLKAESDSLKSELIQTNCYLDADKETIDQLKVENEEFKEKIKAYDEVYSNHDVLNERNKLSKTLTEIKEIADTIKKFAEEMHEDNWGKLDWKIADRCKEILQKISEVE